MGDKIIRRGLGGDVCAAPKCPNRSVKEKIAAIKSLGPVVFRNGKGYHLSCTASRPLTGTDLTK
jgi:hypothetical protein